ncbi:protein POF1B isoform X2 [Scyliorhinus canicula]|uniref:protein POF1B isoform X2 n=1 Tax=Scyliorhinus canicula TaxID=7830 RepID=UPI0018F77F4A|nr:protein POF1B isoform X2 [Scyliorhinus canicula]
MSSSFRPGSSSTASESSYSGGLGFVSSPNPVFAVNEQKSYLTVGSPTNVSTLHRHGNRPQSATLILGQDGQPQYQRTNDVTYEQSSMRQIGLPSPTELQNRQHQYILAQSMKGLHIPKDSEVIVHQTYVTFDPNTHVQAHNNRKDLQWCQSTGHSQTNLEGRFNQSPVQIVTSPSEYMRPPSARSSVTSQEYVETRIRGSVSSEAQSPVPTRVQSPEPARVQSPQLAQIKSAMDYESGNIDKLDPRYFGELLAELTSKTTDLHNILLENIQKIKGKQNRLDVHTDYNGTTENIETLIPKGLSELTKQHLRYLLQTRFTVDKSLRLLLATFNSLREDLLHLQEDLNRLSTDKEMLERDLSFKSQQVTEYLQILESVRENNRQLQKTIKDSGSTNQSLEDLILTLRNSEADKQFRVKELEYSKRALEQENETLRQQLSKSPSVTSIINTDISNNYYEMVNKLREEKDKEIDYLRSQIGTMKREMSSGHDHSSSLNIKLMEYNHSLSEKDTIIKQKDEEISRLKSSQTTGKNVTHTIITKRQIDYPILGLLKDTKFSSRGSGTQTVYIEKTGSR